jgi:pyruvate dehydrogenase E2 component (dihydrolipoamide acetyltransferase)
MTDCTERAQRSEGREGMPGRLSMTDCTEPRLAQVGGDRDGEGHEGMPGRPRMTDCTGAQRRATRACQGGAA